MKKFVLSLAIAGLILQSCGNSSSDKSTVENLRTEAIAIHDEIMPQVSGFDQDIIKIDGLMANMDSLQNTYPDLDTAQTKIDLQGLKANLDRANEVMMTWMMEFEVDPTDMTEAEQKSYYEKEIEKVTDMKRQFEEVTAERAEKLSKFD